ncbi:MAG: hypothetical protein KatS3mg129_2759 [Leptospiraceae bacterium]|nr:MAG: hypothetical protein KatS3mg129_2759 [Leptospiraceae bacterium]
MSVKSRSFLRIIIIMFLLNTLSYCTILQKIFMQKDPEFKIHEIKLHDVKLSGIILKIDSELINYYKFGLPESQLKFDIKINDQLLSKYQSDKFQIAANSSVHIPIYLQLKFADIAKIVSNFSSQKNIKLSMIGGVDFPLDIPGLPKNVHVPFNVEKSIPAFLPKISIEDLNIQLKNIKFQDFTVGAPKLSINLKLLIENEGGSLFTLSKNDLIFQLGSQKILSIKNLPQEPTRSHIIDISTEISLTDSLKNIYDMLITNKNIDYFIKGDLGFQFEDVDFNQFLIPIDRKGQLILNQ